MNWEAIGAIGAIGIIVTLGYLAAQMRTSTNWQKRQGFRDAVTNLRDSLTRIGLFTSRTSSAQAVPIHLQS